LWQRKKTREEAEKNLREVMEIQFEEMIDAGTLLDYLEECGFDLEEGVAFPKSEMVGFEKLEMQVQRRREDLFCCKNLASWRLGARKCWCLGAKDMFSRGGAEAQRRPCC
jgi:hypothetical protein